MATSILPKYQNFENSCGFVRGKSSVHLQDGQKDQDSQWKLDIELVKDTEFLTAQYWEKSISKHFVNLSVSETGTETKNNCVFLYASRASSTTKKSAAQTLCNDNSD